MSEFVVREGRRDDALAAAAILNDWIDETDWMPRIHTHQDVGQFFTEVVFGERETIVAEDDGLVCGLLALEGTRITALYVDADHRRQGVGSALLAEALRRHPDGLSAFAFQANAPALAFYKHHGFAEVRRTEGDNEEHLPDVLLAVGQTATVGSHAAGDNEALR